MLLTKIAAKPQLVEITLDTEEITKQYGEPITFYTWDRQPLDIFMQLANAERSDFTQIFAIVKTMILDEKGNPILDNGVTLPGSILMSAVNKIVEKLGE